MVAVARMAADPEFGGPRDAAGLARRQGRLGLEPRGAALDLDEGQAPAAHGDRGRSRRRACARGGRGCGSPCASGRRRHQLRKAAAAIAGERSALFARGICSLDLRFVILGFATRRNTGTQVRDAACPSSGSRLALIATAGMTQRQIFAVPFARASSSAFSTLGGDIGRSAKRTPVASAMALAMAAIGGTIGVSPTPRTP